MSLEAFQVVLKPGKILNYKRTGKIFLKVSEYNEFKEVFTSYLEVEDATKPFF